MSGYPTQVADGDNHALGTTTDAAITNPATTATLVALIKGVLTVLQAATPAGTNAIGTVAVIPGVGATSLGKAEDAGHSSGDTGVMALAVRNDSGAVLAGTDLDYVPLTTDNTGALRVTGGGGGGGSGDGTTSSAILLDNAPFTDGSTYTKVAGFVFDEVAGVALTENDIAAARIDAKRAQVLVIEDATTRGQRLTISAGGAAKVDGSGVTQPVSIATAPALVASTAVIGKVGIDQTTPGTTNLVSIGTNGTVAIGTALPAGTALLGKVGIDQTTPGTTNLVSIGTNGTVAINAALPAGTNLLGKTGIDQTTPGTTNKVSIGSDGTVTLLAGTAVVGNVLTPFVTVTTTFNRPANVTTYTTKTFVSDSTSAPTSGGFTLTGMGRVSGGSGIITDILIASTQNATLTLQGELYIFDSAGTNGNDDATWALSASDTAKIVAVLPFILVQGPSSSFALLTNLGIGYTCVGSANLRFLVKVNNAYVPLSAETITVRVKAQQLT